jgi:hypothetical protein
MTTLETPAPVKRSGLKPAGIIILQALIIFIIESIEYGVGKIGIITGLVLVALSVAGIFLGRTGTAITNAINPPIAFFFSTIFVMSIFGGAGLHPTRIGLDLVTSMAAVAPYLIISALIGWGGYFYKARK